MSVFPGPSNPIVYAQFAIQGRWRWMASITAGYATVLGSLIWVTAIVVRNLRDLEGWVGALCGLQVLALLVFGAFRVEAAVRGDVTSPSFTIVHEYRGGRLPMYHIDLYRIRNEKDAIHIGLEEYLPGDGVTVIEWPERIASILPPQTRHWELEVVSLTERVIRKREEPISS